MARLKELLAPFAIICAFGVIAFALMSPKTQLVTAVQDPIQREVLAQCGRIEWIIGEVREDIVREGKLSIEHRDAYRGQIINADAALRMYPQEAPAVRWALWSYNSLWRAMELAIEPTVTSDKVLHWRFETRLGWVESQLLAARNAAKKIPAPVTTP